MTNDEIRMTKRTETVNGKLLKAKTKQYVETKNQRLETRN